MVTSACIKTFSFPCPVVKVQFNPRNQNQIFVCPMRHPAVIIDVVSGVPTIIQPEDEVS